MNESPLKVFLYTFNSAHKKQQVVLTKWKPQEVETGDGEKFPLEDFGNYLITGRDIPIQEAFKEWLKETTKETDNEQ